MSRMSDGSPSRTRVTVMVVSFARVHALPALLEALAAQRFAGEIDCIVWNNNMRDAGIVDHVLSQAPASLTVQAIHSSRNHYCLVRLAAAVLAIGELVLFCDDDVVPGPGYVARLVDRFSALSSDTSFPVAVSACGHRFDPDLVGQASAEDVWDSRVGLHFYDEHATQVDLHFMHANSMLLSRETLLRIAARPIPDPVFHLVDDYWISFVLSHEMGARLVKVPMGDQMRFTESAYDPAVALHLRPEVRKARLRMFDFHRRLGWPA